MVSAFNRMRVVRSLSPIFPYLSNDQNDLANNDRRILVRTFSLSLSLPLPTTNSCRKTAAGSIVIARKISDNATRGSVCPSFVPRGTLFHLRITRRRDKGAVPRVASYDGEIVKADLSCGRKGRKKIQEKMFPRDLRCLRCRVLLEATRIEK